MVNALAPSTLASADLARRLAELVGDERHIQVEFLLHLDEFDRRRAWAEIGFPSLWEYALRSLHLREGAAWRRITAMRLVRRFPSLADALRKGRLCLSTVGVLGPVLTEENVTELVAAAAFKTKAEVERLVAGLAPRAAPRDGVRRLPSSALQAPGELPLATAIGPHVNAVEAVAQEESRPAAATDRVATARTPPRPALHPVSGDAYSLRVTLDTALKAQLDELTALLGHKVPSGDVASVLRVALGCAIERFGKRKGTKGVRKAAPAVAQKEGSPAHREGSDKARPPARGAIPAALRREVWSRDGGQCTFRGRDGQRCSATSRLEFDHIVPVALGGTSTIDNVRLACKAHNLLFAERVFGVEHMARFRTPYPTSSTTAATFSSGSG
jgi:5-methylcytosine-specific restriction endonuclease McrA